ncbi:lipopolysaccharide biosynthesis protein [Aurantiacibacter poecillastricola]|uniref:lipopolysaccharide biosynthesis protein n=1 Tax=Aurantiacibacter poecillastricola TaxID=3064385 RepID=UPI00273DE163|nr:oligosaccharide flippase family protein [Aurantiacibacter sp. 219JJ12-13]MDP5260710.1 oligosaccharide flippase family protein [Aurantiacibacter sp. 219JJ12-13]
MPSHGISRKDEASTRRNLLSLFFAKLKDDSAVIVALVVRGLAVLAGFGVTYLIGNNLGPEAMGQYALVTQTAVFFALVGLMGLDVSAVRHFSKSVALGTPIAFLSLAKLVGLSLAFMLAITAVLWLGGDFVWARLFGDAVPQDFLLLLCVLLIGRAGISLFGAILRSQHAFTLGQIIPSLSVPAAAFLALGTGLVFTVEGALWAAAAGSLVALLIGGFVVFHRSGFGENAVHIDMRPVLASSLPLWGVGIAQNLADWYGLAVSAQMLGAADAGLYRASIQIAAVLQIAAMAIFSVYSAKISSAFHAGDRQEAGKLAARAMRFSAWISIAAGIFLMVTGKFILRQIGPEFEEAYIVLYVLIIGQVIFACTGPCGIVLAMSGNEKTNFLISVSTTILLLIVAPIAARYGGLLGVATAIALLLPLRNFIAFIMVYRLEGINVWSGSVKSVKDSDQVPQ